jgi:3-oxoacyl-[acyl-carrier protein] reductase
MENRIALVTGGTGGLGLATAMRFAERGMRVAVADLDGATAAEAAIRLPGTGHIGIGLDIADEAAVIAAFDEVESSVGPVGVLASFAGVLRAGSTGFSIAELTLDEWNKVFAVNATGAFLTTREMARRRPQAPVANTRIILVSSAAAQLGGYQTSAAYIASKGSVLTLIKAAARELAPFGITVNGIAPGPIDTPMLRAATLERGGEAGSYNGLSRVPLNRIGTPEELAAAADYLASPDAAFVTGTVMDVNGGLRMQ